MGIVFSGVRLSWYGVQPGSWRYDVSFSAGVPRLLVLELVYNRDAVATVIRLHITL